jgi:hypothetical protein
VPRVGEAKGSSAFASIDACQGEPLGRVLPASRVTRRVCDARRRADEPTSRRADAAIGVHHTTDSELGVYVVQGVEDVGLTPAAAILSGGANAETRFVEVTMALQNLADWKIRSQVH